MILIIFVGLIYALFISPPDYIQGDSVRIMYVHVPSSFIALGCFGFIGIASIFNLVFKIKFVSLNSKKFSTHWLYFYINFNCYRFIVGKAYLGSLVGLGCKINIYGNFILLYYVCLYFDLEIC